MDKRKVAAELLEAAKDVSGAMPGQSVLTSGGPPNPRLGNKWEDVGDHYDGLIESLQGIEKIAPPDEARDLARAISKFTKAWSFLMSLEK